MASGDTLCVFLPADQEFFGTACATPDTRNSHPVLDFDTGATQEIAIFTAVMPRNYSAATGVTVYVYSALSSATTGTVGWDLAFELMTDGTLDIDADSFATAQTVTATTVPGTSGIVHEQSLAITAGANMDSVTAGDVFRLRIRRDTANDTASGDAELIAIEIRET